MNRDFDDDGTDGELAELRRQDELAARQILRKMASSPKTPATARVAAARALLTDAATRRHDPDLEAKEVWELTRAELQQRIRENQRRLALFKSEPIDAEFEEIAPAGGVFE